MKHFEAAIDHDGSYQRAVSGLDAEQCAAEYAAWYCFHTTEFDDSELVVSVREKNGEWQDFDIEIETVLHFHATPVNR